MKKQILFVFLFFIAANFSQAQLNIPSPSPTQVIRQDFGLSTIELSYSRPGVKGRTIFGDLVPYDKVWRTGANSATTISFGDDVIINGKSIPAGKYGLLSIPGKTEWTFIITRQLDVTNPANYRDSADLVRVTAPVETLAIPVESLTIDFANLTGKSCDLQLSWSKTSVRFTIRNNTDSVIMARIDQVMNKDSRPYYAAAMYYFENNKDLVQALQWFNMATERNPDAFFMFYQKARCQARLGLKEDAIASAKQGLELAKKANNSDYVSLNEKLIASLQ